MSNLKDGFYTALGTPLDKDGNLVKESLKKHINGQIDAGASGLLLMGSMGIEAYLKNSAYADCVKVAAETVGGRLPLFIGAMDTSFARVKEKLDLIGDADIDGIVLTVPYYAPVNDEQAINWFLRLADIAQKPIYLYDLAVVTKYKINMSVIDAVINHKNIKGIKTADFELIKAIEVKYPSADFECLCSRLDSFDYMNMMGIGKNLDGMFACAPKNGKKMADCNRNGDFVGARKYLDNILLLRDTMIQYRLMTAFTYCMNLLGCEGNFHQDYWLDVTDEGKEKLKETMIKIGEI
ncbi:MAG: dihydrodipicolinate synthase family protein [Firmicutes bacterium]|nr:dihydrodipicolinate synthase family protein [Bacillota bacterium]